MYLGHLYFQPSQKTLKPQASSQLQKVCTIREEPSFPGADMEPKYFFSKVLYREAEKNCLE